jgi:drug/metabolite transporter (DMT)-like permease
LINGTIVKFYQPFGHLDFVMAIAYLGIFSTLLTSYLSTYALSILPSFQMSIFGNLTTVVTILVGIIFLDESFYYYHVIGSILIIAGVIGVNYVGRKGKKEAGLIEPFKQY